MTGLLGVWTGVEHMFARFLCKAVSGSSPKAQRVARPHVLLFTPHEVSPGFLKELREGRTLLLVRAHGQSRFEAPYILACDKFLHESSLPERVAPSYHMLAGGSGSLRKAPSGPTGYSTIMEAKAIEILDQHRLMTIATLRADGWPQATMVNYANDGLLLYFIISKHGQKYANIVRDSRVAVAVGRDYEDPSRIRALSIAANASDVRDPKQRERAIDLVMDRHPTLAALGRPDPGHSAVMRAYCSIVSILDYSKGFGHADLLTVSGGITEMAPRRDDDWGFLNPARVILPIETHRRPR